MCVERIAERVAEGGHHVPEADVRRRYQRGIANFLNVYRALADYWIVFDNSGPHPREFAFEVAGKTTILDAEAFQRFEQAGATP